MGVQAPRETEEREKPKGQTALFMRITSWGVADLSRPCVTRLRTHLLLAVSYACFKPMTLPCSWFYSTNATLLPQTLASNQLLLMSAPARLQVWHPW